MLTINQIMLKLTVNSLYDKHGEGIVMLKNDKVMLRSVRMSDCDSFLKWLNDPEVISSLGFYLPVTEMAEKKWIESYGQNKNSLEVMFVIETIEDPRPIGFCVINKINYKDRNAEFTIVIGESEKWSKGLGSEASKLIIGFAFNQLNLHRIYTGAYDFNQKSISMLKRLGFEEEGCQRQAVYKNGEYHNVILFGLLKEEFT